MGDRVHILDLPTPATALDAVTSMRGIFPQPGVYYVEPLVKAETQFDEWFLQRVLEIGRARFLTSQEAIWEVLDGLLEKHGVNAPSELDYWELQRTLFDLTNASTAHMVGLRVPKELTGKLQAVGWKPPETLDFPAIAYRIGKIYQELESGRPQSWSKLLQHAGSRPLSRVEELAIKRARQCAGMHLRPVYDATGQVWATEREIEPLRRITAEAIRERTGVRRAARELAATNRAQGIFRDAERVMRTEIADAAGHAHWQEHSKRWKDSALIYRPTSSDPCRECLRLYKLPDGMPRLYRRQEVERLAAQGPNRGPRDTWRPQIGPTHPNCVCPGWVRWFESTRALVATRAPEFEQKMRRLGVFKEAA